MSISLLSRSVVGAALCFSIGIGAAQDKPPNYFAKHFTLSGQMRARWEATQGADFSPTPADSYLASRIRFGVAFKPSNWLRFFGEAQDSRVLFYKVKPPAVIADPFDWRQGYVEVGALEGDGVRLRLGRQELTLGSGRLLTTGDWNNVTRAFNIARGNLNFGSFNMDLIAGSQVLIDPNRMDRSKPGEHVYADYMTFKKLIPNASVEPYFFAKTAKNVKSKDGVLGNADTLYMGLRLIGKAPRGFDYNFEGVREAGSHSNDSVSAWGYVAGGGWTSARLPWKLHLSSDFTYASGDSGVADGRHQSFDFLYGNQQPLNSLSGLFSWRNIENWRAGVDFSPMTRLVVRVDYRNYWLATVTDGLYNCTGAQAVMNKLATSNHIGEGVEALAIFALNGKTSIGVGMANLAPGSYLTQSGKTSGFVYPFLTFTRNL